MIRKSESFIWSFEFSDEFFDIEIQLTDVKKKKIRTYIKTERWHSKNENKLHELSVYGKYFCISWQFEHSWHLQWSKWASLLRLIIAAFKQQFYYLKKCYMFTYLLLLFGIFRGTSGLSISL